MYQKHLSYEFCLSRQYNTRSDWLILVHFAVLQYPQANCGPAKKSSKRQGLEQEAFPVGQVAFHFHLRDRERPRKVICQSSQKKENKNKHAIAKCESYLFEGQTKTFSKPYNKLLIDVENVCPLQQNLNLQPCLIDWPIARSIKLCLCLRFSSKDCTLGLINWLFLILQPGLN